MFFKLIVCDKINMRKKFGLFSKDSNAVESNFFRAFLVIF